MGLISYCWFVISHETPLNSNKSPIPWWLNPHMIGFPTFPKCSSAMFISTSFDATASHSSMPWPRPKTCRRQRPGSLDELLIFFETSGSILKKFGFWMILDDPSPNFSESFRYIVAFPLILSFVWEKKNWGFQIVSNWKHGQLGQRQFWVKCCLIIPVVEGSPVLPRGMSQGGFNHTPGIESTRLQIAKSDHSRNRLDKLRLPAKLSLMCTMTMSLLPSRIIWYVRPAKKCQETDVHFRSQCPRLLNDQDHLPFVLDLCNSSGSGKT